MITLDMRDFEKAGKRLKAQADQLPFAIMLALNETLKSAKTELVEHTWPSHVKVRNQRFLNWALRMQRAKKTDLVIALIDKSDGRGNLALHARGGTRMPRGGLLAIPTPLVKRTGSGAVAGSQKPRMLKRVVKKKGLIFQAVGRGKNSKLKLMYKLTSKAKIKADVPFSADFERAVRIGMAREFPIAIAKAMATR